MTSVADEQVIPATKVDNVGYMSVIDKPAQCAVPKIKLDQKQFKNQNLTVYLTVQDSKDGSHWVIGHRKFLKDPRRTKITNDMAAFNPITSATIHCEDSAMISGL